MTPTAVIAEDEPAVAADLQQRLAQVWPELAVAEVAGDGPAALAAIQRAAPDVAFLDIQLPGLTGTEIAAALPAGCRLVFVTAHEQFAVTAFEQGAADYLLKPVTAERLARTRTRLEQAWQAGQPAPAPQAAAQALAQASPWLAWIRAGLGERVTLIPVDDVVYFQARAKYTSVVTAVGESVIRTPIKTLAGELDPQKFWRIHRATIVRLAEIEHARRLPGGRLRVALKSRPEALTVSRAYAAQFREM